MMQVVMSFAAMLLGLAGMFIAAHSTDLFLLDSSAVMTTVGLICFTVSVLSSRR